MSKQPPPLTWRNVSTPNLRDFIGYDGERSLASIYQRAHGNREWFWSVFAVCPAIPGVTSRRMIPKRDVQPSPSRPRSTPPGRVHRPLPTSPRLLRADRPRMAP
jgi:hypothetical protein